jgi:hypothetical protein
LFWLLQVIAFCLYSAPLYYISEKLLLLLLLLLLQVIAFCLYSAPLYYMSEKLLGVHTKSMPLKLMARLPVCKYQDGTVQLAQHMPVLL